MTTQSQKDTKVAAAQKALDKITQRQTVLVAELDQLETKCATATAHRDWLTAMPVDPEPSPVGEDTTQVGRRARKATTQASALTGVGTPPEGAGPLTNTGE